MANKAYRYRLYPNREQDAYFARWFGGSRFVYNQFLRLTSDAYAESRKHLQYTDTAKLLTKLKKKKAYTGLSEVNDQLLQQTLKNQESVFMQLLIKFKNFPRLKKKHECQLFKELQPGSITEKSELKSTKMQPIKMVMHRQIEGKPTKVKIQKPDSKLLHF